MSQVNGRELTSEDVKYSIERQMTDQPGKYQHAYFFLGKLASIETPDKYTVVFKTHEPLPLELHRQSLDGDRGARWSRSTAICRSTPSARDRLS